METLQNGEQKRVQKAIAYRVYELDETSKHNANLFKALYSDIKKQFGVTSYKEINRKDMQRALRFIENWKPRKVS